MLWINVLCIWHRHKYYHINKSLGYTAGYTWILSSQKWKHFKKDVKRPWETPNLEMKTATFCQKISAIFGAHSWVFDQFSKLHIWPLCASPEAESNFSFSSRVQYPVGSPHLRRFLSWVSRLSNIFPSQFLTFGCKALSCVPWTTSGFVLVFQTQPWTHNSALSNLSILPSFKVNVFL